MQSLFGKENYVYNASLRGYVILFGSLFSGMVLNREGKWIGVPLRHGRGNLYEKAPQNVAQRDETRVREVLPSASFYLENVERDSSRQTSRFQPIDLDKGQEVEYRVPYLISFSLDVRNKNMDDHLQILEQISTVFDPTYTAFFKPWKDSERVENVVVTLDGFSIDDNSDTQAEDEERRIETNYRFSIKGYLNKGVSKTDVVEEVVFATGTDDYDISKSVFVTDKGTLKIMKENDALASMIESGLVETVLVNPDVLKDTTKPNRRKKKLNN